MDIDLVLSWMASDNGLAVHLAVFIALLLGGLAFPIPEDIPIILAGVAAAKGIVFPQIMWITCYTGVLLADQFVYWIGYLWGNKLLQAGARSRFFPNFTPEKVEELRDGLRRRRLFLIFVSRHLFPIRSVTFLTAGALRVPFWEFILADALAALVSVSLVFGLGYFLGESLTPEVMSHILNEAHIYFTGVLALVLIWFLLRRMRNSKRVENLAPANSINPNSINPNSMHRSGLAIDEQAVQGLSQRKAK